MKKIVRPLLVFIVSLSLVGCGDSTEDTYNDAVETGIEYIATEDYENAETSFELALETKPEDDYAQAVLMQVESYRTALDAFENENDEQALKEAENILTISEASDEMTDQANDLVERIQTKIDRELAKEKAKKEVEEAKLQAEQEAAERERERVAQAEREAAEVEVSSTASYTYEDFKGIYGVFEGEPYTSQLVVTYILSDHLLTDIVTDWMEYVAADITNITIDDNMISIDYAGNDGMGPIGYEPGTFEASLEYREDGLKTLIMGDHSMVEMTREQFDAYGLTINEASFKGL